MSPSRLRAFGASSPAETSAGPGAVAERSEFPVNFLVAVVPWSGSKEQLSVERLIVLDGSGQAITSVATGGWVQDGLRPDPTGAFVCVGRTPGRRP